MATGEWPALSQLSKTQKTSTTSISWASMTVGDGKAVGDQKKKTAAAAAAATVAASKAKTAAEASEKEELLEKLKRMIRKRNIGCLVDFNSYVSVDVSPRVILGGEKACFNVTVVHSLTVNISATGQDELDRLAEQRLNMLDLDKEDFSTAVTMFKEGLLDFGSLNTFVDLTRTTPKRADEMPLYEQLNELGVTKFLEKFKLLVLEHPENVLDVLKEISHLRDIFLLPIQQIIALF